MLKLTNIVKNYQVADTEIKALKGVSMEFRKNEFVSILGQSGCGKTTLLNIIGGLDRYTSGDLVINGRSTKEYTDRDWDTYRNHSIGFVFQSYNLIPHQTVLGNVELALTLSGVSKEERRKRAIDALEKVGLKDQINKKPNQMSGGQMQRVAIARALVNNPDIILADEPTGALDTHTSVQIMDILKEISKDKLIIMVTHNPELANEYSNRIIKLLDGEVISDSNPYTADEEEIVVAPKEKKSRMTFLTALSLSFKNLITKKGRTIITAFAGSIGIIGIALILSLSDGFQNYINKVQEDTLSTYPITIEKEAMDYSAMLTGLAGSENKKNDLDKEVVYTNDVMISIFNSIQNSVKANNLSKFKNHLDNNEEIKDYVSAIQYSYDVNFNLYDAKTNEVLNETAVFTDLMYDVIYFSALNNIKTEIEKQYAENKITEEQYNAAILKAKSDAETEAQMVYNMMASGITNLDMGIWSEMLDNQELLDSQYDVIKGMWPTESNNKKKHNQIVLVIDENNCVSDYALYALGIKTSPSLKEVAEEIANSKDYKLPASEIKFEDILNRKFKLVLTPDYYQNDGTGYVNKSEDTDFVNGLLASDKAIEVEIVGIVRPKKNISATSITGTIGYTRELTNYLIEKINNNELVKKQIDNPDVNVLTNIEFNTTNKNYTISEVKAYLATSLGGENGVTFANYIVNGMVEDTMTNFSVSQAEAEIIVCQQFKDVLDKAYGEATYQSVLNELNYVSLDSPSMINIYCIDFESKDGVQEIIKNYNNQVREEDKITYTDYIGIMMSSISTIINAISYVLIGFVSISLVVSSIMIGIITYISVLERTKEIGILRSIGASKKDISRVFNAETLIIGFTAGILGIGTTLLLNIPINLVINALAGIGNVAALPWLGGLILICISMGLTLIAGIIPARVAAKKDPVIALRTE